MYVVTGMARSGTSMMMQTLIHLGIETPAKPFLKEHNPIKDKNPKGFYELYEEVKGGIQHNNYKGQAVKLFGGSLLRTPSEYISKMIVMKRNKEDCLKSYTPIWEIMKDGYTPEYIYDANYIIIDEYVKKVSHIFINFEELVLAPDYEIMKVIKFLEINPTKKQISNAIKNIEICRY